MKTNLLIALMMVITTFASAQVTATVYPNQSAESNIGMESGEAIYLVGCDHMPEYKLEMKTCSTKGQVKLSNGRTAPALNCFIVDKKEYIGGTLVFDKKTTEIVDIKMEPVGKEGAMFTVVGKGFDMSFTLIDGMILRISGEEVIFHTKGKGAWKIKKA